MVGAAEHTTVDKTADRNNCRWSVDVAAPSLNFEPDVEAGDNPGIVDSTSLEVVVEGELVPDVLRAGNTGHIEQTDNLVLHDHMNFAGAVVAYRTVTDVDPAGYRSVHDSLVGSHCQDAVVDEDA